MRTLTLITVAVMTIVAATLAAAQSPQGQYCVVTPLGGKQVNLTAIAAATYDAQLATDSGLKAVKVHMSWCKEYAESQCGDNQTDLSMVLVDAASKKCLAAFTAITGPAMALSNTTFSFVEWSAGSGDMATVTVQCDASVPAGTAKLDGIVTTHPFWHYFLTFNSSTACGAAAAAPKKKKTEQINFKPHH